MRVLLLNAGHTEIPIIKRLKEMDYYVITSGNREDMPGHSMADEYVKADYSNYEEILKIAREKSIDRIVSCAYDTAYITACYVAEKMNLGGHDTFENACVLHQKDKFKKLCDMLEIPNPTSIPFDDERVALEYLSKAKYPIIAKATDQASGIGIMRANNVDEGIVAIKNAFDKSRNGRIVIEPYIIGAQESFVAFVVDKRVVSCTSCNCYSPINPYLIQTETMPSDNFDLLRDQLISITEKLFNELKLVDGIITLQYIVKDNVPYIIEMMRRCLGNRFLYPVSYVTGMDWYEWLVKAECNIDCHNIELKKPLAKFAGHHAIMTDKKGIYNGIKIPEDILEHVVEFDELYSIGQVIDKPLSERMGYIYYTYDSRKDINDAAESFNERIMLDVK